jgi:hypothetical protein
MKVNILAFKGNWKEIRNSCMTTVAAESKNIEPSSSWKRRLLLSSHSPIRQLIIKWKWTDLLWWVQTHYTRHHVGVEWWVQTSRTDRTGIDRTEAGSQSNLINVEGEANAQAIIDISRRRLCFGASKETRDAWIEFLMSFKDEEPELFSVCQPECIFRGYCYEFKSCGYFKSENYQETLKLYRQNINA